MRLGAVLFGRATHKDTFTPPVRVASLWPPSGEGCENPWDEKNNVPWTWSFRAEVQKSQTGPQGFHVFTKRMQKQRIREVIQSYAPCRAPATPARTVMLGRGEQK